MSPEAGTRVVGRGGVWLVVALGALSAFGPLCLDMYLPALPELPGALSSTAGAAQLSLTSCIVGLALGQLLIGPLSDRIGRRRPLLVGVAVFAVASALCAVTGSMPVLIGLRFVQGAAGAAGIVVGRAVVADLFAGRVAAAYFSTMAAINGLAPILAPVIGAQVLRVGTWRTVFWVLAGIGVALWLLTLLVVGETLPAERRSAHGFSGVLRSFSVVLADRVYLGYVVAGTTVSAAMFGYIAASPFLLQDGFGLSPQQFSACFAGNAAGIVIASQLSRLLLRRFSPAALLRWALGQSAAGAALLTVSVFGGLGLWSVLVALFVMVSAVGFALPNASALAMDRHRPIAGAASAVFGLFQYALATVTTVLVGLGDRAVGTALAVTALGSIVIGALALAGARSAVRAETPNGPPPLG